MSSILSKLGGASTNRRGNSNAGSDDQAPSPDAQETETEILCVASTLILVPPTMVIHLSSNNGTTQTSDENQGSIIMSLISQLRWVSDIPDRSPLMIPY
jgi:hypothetical protein